MDFFTQVGVPAADFKIDYRSSLMFVGSCFADNISRQWANLKFNVLSNPFGTIYNPLSIAEMFARIARCEKSPKDTEGQPPLTAPNAAFTEGDVFFDGENWCCWNASSKFVGEDQSQETFIEKLNLAASTLRKTIAELLAINPIIHIVFTVSPLRHLSDGAHENNISKATLLLAVENAREDSSASYFPSYEIVMDELRDYRFYKNDMIHLSEAAEDYIFECKTSVYCEAVTIVQMKHVEKFMKTANHRTVNAGSARTTEFAQQQIAIATELEKQIGGLDLSEKNHFTK